MHNLYNHPISSKSGADPGDGGSLGSSGRTPLLRDKDALKQN